MTTQTRRRSSSFRIWSDRIDGGVITKHQCVQYAHAIGGLLNGWAGGHRTNLTTEDAEELYDKLAAKRSLFGDGLAILPEHAELGYKWIERYGTKMGLPVGADAREAIALFRFVGAYDYNDGSGRHYRPQMAPIYRVYLTDGRRFDYAPTPWQASEYGAKRAPLAWAWVQNGEGLR